MSHGPCVEACEVRYWTMNGLKLASGRLALGVRKGCQNQNTCKWYRSFPKELGPVRREGIACQRSRQVVKHKSHWQTDWPTSAHYEVIKNEKSQRSYHIYSAALIDSTLHAPKCTRHTDVLWKSSAHIETSSHHGFSVPWHDSIPRLPSYKFWSLCMYFVHQSSLCYVGNSSCEPWVCCGWKVDCIQLHHKPWSINISTLGLC
jgi:hypothetical protein